MTTRILPANSVARVCTLALGLLPACGIDRDARTPDTAQALQVTHVRADGMALEMACTPTGPERCFDAIDDNCNGLIDEGCGTPTGLVQWMLSWGDSPADLQLAMIDPGGIRISAALRGKNQFRFVKDCPAQACFGQNLETIVYDGTDPPKGIYVVEVTLGDLGGAALPVHAHLGARIGSRSFGAAFTLDTAEDRKTLMFEL
jgi:hypothetical protein